MGADINGLDPETGKTALTVAVERRDYNTIRLLIAAGADLSSPIERLLGNTPLGAAVKTDDISVIRYLVEMGGDPDEHCLISAIDKSEGVLRTLLAATLHRYSRLQNGFGSRALQYAIKKPNIEAIEVLLLNGVDTNVIVRYHQDYCWDSYSHEKGVRGHPAFSVALQSDQAEGFHVVKRLLHAGANPNLLAAVSQSMTGLMIAIDRNSLDLVQLLILNGADVNLRVDRRRSHSPLQLATKLGNMEIIELLLEQGADVNAPPRHSDGATALQFACINGHLGVALALLKRGAYVDAAPAKINGRTALEGASEHGRIDIVPALLDAGARLVGPGSEQYKRAREMASEMGHPAVRRLLDTHHNKMQAASEAVDSGAMSSEIDQEE